MERLEGERIDHSAYLLLESSVDGEPKAAQVPLYTNCRQDAFSETRVDAPAWIGS
jgi:hypothetical protein